MTVAEALVAYVKEQGAEDTFRGSIDYNPLRRQFKHGVEGVDVPAIVADAVKLLDIVAPVPALRCLAVDSLILANSGAYIYQELGYALAWGTAWMNALTDAGRKACEVASRFLEFLHGNRQIPRCPHALGTDSRAVSARLHRLCQDDGLRHNLAFQPDNIRCTCESAP